MNVIWQIEIVNLYLLCQTYLSFSNSITWKKKPISGDSKTS